MGPYVWCAVGIVLGWLSGGFGSGTGLTERLESVAVGIFGAFLGGEFLPAMVLKKAAGAGLDAGTVSMGIAGAVVALLLLRWMRHAVGPLKTRKKKEHRVV
jgi:uncharacterized membrane protein YeaQ/YmgE (transglycosylase-associated protein family)